MKRFQFSFVVALLMATVSVQAQRSPAARGERNVRGGIATARQHTGTSQRGTRSVGTRAQASLNAANRGGARCGTQRGIRNGRSIVQSHRRTPVLRLPGHSHGYYRTVSEPVLVHAGHWHRDYVPAVYGWVFDSCGLRVWGIVEPAHYHRVWVDAQYEYRQRQVWVGY